jgi:uncharacterized protein (DUF2236 family)
MLRQVHGERRVGLMYGQRALTVGAIKPLNYVGTTEHSGHKGDPFKRLTRTAMAFESIFFGTRAEADRILAYVEKMHARVHGELPADAGIYAAGTPYDAFDAPLMVWTVAAMMDSAEVMHDLLVRQLTDDEREALWQDYVRFGELFLLPREAVPPTYREFQAWFDGKLASPDLHATEHALEMAPLVAFRQPVPPHARANIAVQNLVIKGTLPARVRQIFGIEWSAGHEAAFQAIAASHRRARPAFPRRMRRGRNDYFFNLVRDREKRRGGTATPQIHTGAA